MYLIPKNIKIKKEIFKGFGMIELLAMALSFGIGYLMTMLSSFYQVKVFLFFILPLSMFILLLPLPNGSTALKILIKFIKYQRNQKKYKIKN
jgi:hypothetical protein